MTRREGGYMRCPARRHGSGTSTFRSQVSGSRTSCSPLSTSSIRDPRPARASTTVARSPEILSSGGLSPKLHPSWLDSGAVLPAVPGHQGDGGLESMPQRDGGYGRDEQPVQGDELVLDRHRRVTPSDRGGDVAQMDPRVPQHMGGEDGPVQRTVRTGHHLAADTSQPGSERARLVVAESPQLGDRRLRALPFRALEPAQGRSASIERLIQKGIGLTTEMPDMKSAGVPNMADHVMHGPQLTAALAPPVAGIEAVGDAEKPPAKGGEGRG